MALLRISELRSLHAEYVGEDRLVKSAAKLMGEAAGVPLTRRFDVFLAHSFADSEVILLVKRHLQRIHGLSVYVDWIVDRQVDRSKVNTATAQMLKARIRNSRALFVATSVNSTQSVWIPWELGYADAHHGRVAILPLLRKDLLTDSFKGQEYLGLYPYIDEATAAGGDGSELLWVNNNARTYIWLGDWFRGAAPTRRG